MEEFHEEREKKMITDFDDTKFKHERITEVETKEEKEEIQKTMAILPTYFIIVRNMFY